MPVRVVQVRVVERTDVTRGVRASGAPWFLQPTAVADRLRHSLFAIPVSAIVLAVVLAWALVRTGAGNRLLGDGFATLESARAILGAIATGSITAVSLILSMLLVAVSLTAGQFSPRTTQNLLGDRLHQATIGVMLGTVAFSLVGLRAVDEVDGRNTSDFVVLVAILLAVIELLLLVASSNRLTKRLRIGTVVEDLTDRTCSVIRADWGAIDEDVPVTGRDRTARVPDDRAGAHGDRDPDRGVTSAPPSSGTSWIRPARGAGDRDVPDGEWSVVASDRGGWIQAIDEAPIAQAIPEGATVRVQCAVGRYVLPGAALAHVSVGDLDDSAVRSIRRAVVIGGSRTLQFDAAFGIVQLEDIGLRALSPGINDPNTAREIAIHLGEILLELHRFPEPSHALVVDGRELVRASVPSHGDLVDASFEQLRAAASGNVAVLRTFVDVIANVLHEVTLQELPGPIEGLEALLGRLRLDLDRATSGTAVR